MSPGRVATVVEYKPYYYCNLSCAFCVFSGRVGKEIGSSHRLSLRAHLEKVKERARQVDYFVVSGGEPTTDPLLIETLHEAQAILRPTRIVLHTNGVRLSRDRLVRSLMAFPNLSVFMSFHTLEVETFQLYTGTTKLARVKAAVSNVVAAGIPLHTHTLLMQPTMSELDPLVGYLHDRGAAAIELRFPFGTTLLEQRPPWLYPRDMAGCAEILLKLLRSHGAELRLIWHASLPCALREHGANPHTVEQLFRYAAERESVTENFGTSRQRYFFLDPRDANAVEASLQQTALNRSTEVATTFQRIEPCDRCSFKEVCVGLPVELITGSRAGGSFASPGRLRSDSEGKETGHHERSLR